MYVRCRCESSYEGTLSELRGELKIKAFELSRMGYVTLLQSSILLSIGSEARGAILTFSSY